MTTEPEDKPGGEEEEENRPTVAPPFDPVAFAQAVLGGKPSPPAGTPAVGLPPESEAGVPSKAHGPHSRKTPRAMGRVTPVGAPRPLMPTLTDPAELEAARVQSVGSTPAGRRPSPQGLLSLANARIPSNLPPRKMSTDSLGAVDLEWEALATSAPPPQQQELIDATARGDGVTSAKRAPGLAFDEPGAASAVAPLVAVAATAQEMNDRVALGDYTGALEIAEKLLEIDPDDEPVKVCAESCRGVLHQMYIARIGPLDRVPMVMVARDQLRWLSIDHRAGFVLALVDGVSSLEMILDVSGMPPLDALRILSELAQQRIISFR